MEDQQTSDSGFTNPVSDAVETEPVETEILDALPDKTISGRDFTILLRTGMEYEFFSEDLTGEIINDAVHERNTYLEDRYQKALDKMQEAYAD